MNFTKELIVNVIDHFKKYKYNILFYFLIILIVCLNLCVFLNSTNKNLFHENNGIFINLFRFSRYIIYCVILTSPYFLLKRKKEIIFIPLILIDFFIFFDVLYHRAYYIGTPLDFDNITGLANIIVPLIKLTDLSFIIPTLILFILYYLSFRKKLQAEQFYIHVPLLSKIVNKFIIKEFERFTKYRFNLLFYSLIVLIVYFNFWLFFDSVDKTLFEEKKEFFTKLFEFSCRIANCLIITLPYFFLKRKKGTVFIFLFLLNLLIFSNILYYRVYNTIMPLHSFILFDNLKGLSTSIISLIRFSDLFFVVPTLALQILYYLFFRKRLQTENLRLRVPALLVTSILTLSLVFASYIRSKNDPLLSFSRGFYYDQVKGTYIYGFVPCWLWQLNELRLSISKGPTETEMNKIESWLNDNGRDRVSKIKDGKFSKNVILIIVESFESFTIDSKINGKEITPCINRLLKNEKCLYASKVLPQIKDGRSSDIQVIINTGLLPINSCATCFRYPHNNYFSLAKALKNKGYNSHTFISNKPSFWNQGEMTKAYGYDDLYSQENLLQNDIVGMGISDSSLFVQSARIIKKFRQPFFTQMVTLSSHTPFIIPENKIKLKLPKDSTIKLFDYLTSINYVDNAIGEFIENLKKEGLFNNSMIIITGDHNAFITKEYEQFSKDKYGKDFTSKYGYVPLIVINAPKTFQYDNVIGQIDIYPTLIDLMNLTDYNFMGLGTSLLNKKKPSFAINSRFKAFGDTSKVIKKDINHKISAWEISDLMIKTNYFNYIPNSRSTSLKRNVQILMTP